MIAHARQLESAVSVSEVQERFLAMLPAIRYQARYAFRRQRPHVREELIDEVIADCYVALHRLVERGKGHLAFPTPLAHYSIRRVLCGRRVGSKLNKNDITGPYAQRIHGLRLERLDRWDDTKGSWKEVLVEDRRATPAEVAAARIDVAAWFRRLARRDRKIAKQLAVGHRTRDVAKRFRLSPARISQLRQELNTSWRDFQGEKLPPQLVVA